MLLYIAMDSSVVMISKYRSPPIMIRNPFGKGIPITWIARISNTTGITRYGDRSNTLPSERQQGYLGSAPVRNTHIFFYVAKQTYVSPPGEKAPSNIYRDFYVKVFRSLIEYNWFVSKDVDANDGNDDDSVGRAPAHKSNSKPFPVLYSHPPQHTSNIDSSVDSTVRHTLFFGPNCFSVSYANIASLSDRNSSGSSNSIF